MKRAPKRKQQRGVVVLGEVLCDLFPPRAGLAFKDAPHFVPLLGGAPGNVAVQLARARIDTALISTLGDDPIGDRVLSDLDREGVDVKHVQRRSGWRTGVTLVEVRADGERRFVPLADKRADLSIHVDDVDAAFVARFRMVHTGTVILRAPSSRAAHDKLVAVARAAGNIVSLDVNLRPAMYPSRNAMLTRARAAVKCADIVKATRDEARLLANDDAHALDDDALLDRLLSRGPSLAMLTLDKDGALLKSGRARVHVRAPKVRVKDATGAGDAFMGMALAALVRLDIKRDDLATLDAAVLTHVGKLACAAGSRTCTALGATTAMPRA